MANGGNRVVVVGAGPVGLIAVLALAPRGLPVTLLTAEIQPIKQLRGSTFHPPTLDPLDEFGIVSAMIEIGLKASTRDRNMQT